MKLKRKIGMIAVHVPCINNLAVILNNVLFHWREREQEVHFGKENLDKQFYVIRSSGREEGLLSLYFAALREISSAKKHGMIPIIDFQNYKTQYNVSDSVEGTMNAWEYYFEQPSSFSLDEVYKSKNVRLSGWKVFKNKYSKVDFASSMFYFAPVKASIMEKATEIANQLALYNAIGVFIRGTDYISQKPKGHYVQPTAHMVMDKLEELEESTGERPIFLATEDGNIWNLFKERYGSKVISDDSDLIFDYCGKEYIASSIASENMYEFGLRYLIKMICLSQCGYLIASHASGSDFAAILNDGKYKYSYFFELGRYK